MAVDGWPGAVISEILLLDSSQVFFLNEMVGLFTLSCTLLPSLRACPSGLLLVSLCFACHFIRIVVLPDFPFSDRCSISEARHTIFSGICDRRACDSSL